jgi:voltage-gated sodium channel
MTKLTYTGKAELPQMLHSENDNEGEKKPKNILIRICKVVYTPFVSNFVLIVILINAVVLGLETSPDIHGKFGRFLRIVDQLCLIVFCVELLMKMICEKFRFFLSAWNLFDFVIVGISVVPGANHLSVLRALRILRAMRLITKLPKLRIIAESIIHALPSIGWISILLIIIFYIFAVLSTTLFGVKFHDWFGNIGASMYTLFQMLTLESWSMGIARPVMHEFPYAYLVFIPFILISSFIVLNVFIGVIVNSIHEVSNINEKPLEDGEDKAPETVTYGLPAAGMHVVGPDHLKGLGNELVSLREQLNRIEEMLKEQWG